MSVSCGAINGLVAAFSFTLDLDLKGVLNSSGRLVPIFNRKDTKSNHFLLLFFDFIWYFRWKRKKKIYIKLHLTENEGNNGRKKITQTTETAKSLAVNVRQK